MNKHINFLATSLLSLAGCVSNQAIKSPMLKAQPGQPYTLTPENLGAIKAAVSNGMKDPLSTQFQNVRATRNEVKVTVCGEVNGKNSYGGYTGFSPFIAFLIPDRNVATVTDMAGSDATADRVNLIYNECIAAGIR